MKRIGLPLALVIAAIGLAVVEFAYRYPRLPDRIASHFDFAGRPDGWMTKSQFATTGIGMLGMLAFTFSMACVVAAVLPMASFNLPRKDYWLAPQRQDIARRMIVERLLWLMAATMMLLAYISHEVLKVNLAQGGQLTAWTPLAIFLAFTVLWCGELVWTFNRTPQNDAE